MTHLTITDLSVNESLDSKRMQAVRGGLGFAPWIFGPSFSSTDITKTITQSNAQMQSVTNMVGNGSAFLDDVKGFTKTSQTATNSVS
jgi:hypothetical protein